MGSDQFPIAFGKYMLTELIAVGGMAEVYRAKIFGAEGFEKDMVVKRILPKFSKNPNFVQMLIDEAKIAVSLTHGNIVPIYELGELEGDYYIAMEYVAGRTVLDVLRECHGKQRPLPWPYALGIAAEVARGLAYAHTQKKPDGTDLGLIHRDINPRNIVITPSGEVKILDFGIAMASTKKTQTKSGVIKGTPGYMSPEQAYGKTLDARSDIYCLGILVHELLTLERLFPVWTVAEMRDALEKRKLHSPTSFGLCNEQKVDEVIMKSLSFDLASRYQDAADFEEALRGVMAVSGTAVTSSGIAREIERITKGEAAARRPTPPAVATVQTIPPAPGPASEPPEPARPEADEDKPETKRELPNAPGTAVMGSLPTPPVATPQSRAVPLAPEDVEERSPKTQPMTEEPPAPTGPVAPFVISLADGTNTEPARPLAPLPKTSHDTKEMAAPRTQVLAVNNELEWSENIGEDAELLAIAQAIGGGPAGNRRTLLVGGVIAAVVFVLVGAIWGGQIGEIVSRAISGKKLRNGALIVKTTPSGAEVLLDGKVVGKTNMKMTGVDPDRAHQLVVRPEGMDQIILEITPEEFKMNEGVLTYAFIRDFVKKEEPEPEPEPKPKKRRRKKRRR
jgi:serine/threonine protein kinase